MADLGNITALKAAIDSLLNNSVPDESIEPDDHNALLDDLLDTITGLDKVLRHNNETGGYNLTITAGDLIKLADSGFTGDIDTATLSANQTYTFQDASGTIAFLSDISSGVTNLGIANKTASTLDVTSDTGTDATVPSFNSTEAGLTPASGGGTTNFLRADGTWATAGGATNLGIANITANNLDVTSDTGTDATVPTATASDAGLMPASKFNEVVANSAKIGLTDGDKGDVTVSSSGAQWDIDNDVVTYAKIQNVTDERLLGNFSGSAGDVQEIQLSNDLQVLLGVLGLNTTPLYISDITTVNLLDDVANWDLNGNYTGALITGTFQGQHHVNSTYWFTCTHDNVWIRMARI